MVSADSTIIVSELPMVILGGWNHPELCCRSKTCKSRCCMQGRKFGGDFKPVSRVSLMTFL